LLDLKNKSVAGVTACILSLTAVLKLAKIAGSNEGLFRPDPVLGFLMIREVLFMVSILEIFAVAMLYSHWPTSWKSALVASLSSCFLVYRISLMALYHGQTPCSCLGLLDDWSMLPKAVSETISYILLFFLLVTSYGGLLDQVKKN